jgi:adenine-specific DNA-methyltransferase
LFDIASIEGRRASLVNAPANLFLATLSDESIDLVVTSPPYCIGKEYEKSTSTKDFLDNHRRIFPEVVRVLRPGGSMCWQVGHHVKDGVATPLDALVYMAALDSPELILRNRIV